jgi:uncharacterized integral membrane protein
VGEFPRLPMRLIKSLIALCFIALGIVFGALNTQPVHVELWFRSFDARLGLVLLCVLLAGALVGGLAVTVAVVWPMRRRLGRALSGATSPTSAERAPRP